MLNIWKVVSTHNSILLIGEYKWISSYYMETCFQLRAALLWNCGECLYTCARWGRTQGPDSFLANYQVFLPQFYYSGRLLVVYRSSTNYVGQWNGSWVSLGVRSQYQLNLQRISTSVELLIKQYIPKNCLYQRSNMNFLNMRDNSTFLQCLFLPFTSY